MLYRSSANLLIADIFVGRREMLWIEYDSTTLDVLTAQTVIGNIAKIIIPFPVAAYSTQETGFGLLAHDGFYEGYDDDSSATSSNSSGDVSPSTFVNPFIDHLVSQLETLAIEDMTSLALDFETDNTRAFDGNSTEDSNGSSDDSRGESNTSPERNGNSNGNSSGSSPSQTSDDSYFGEEQADDKDDGKATPPTPSGDPPLDFELCFPSGTFTGTTKLNLSPSLSQNLSISFDLQIDPSHQRGKINCAILIDNLVVRASDDDSVATIPKIARYTTNRLAITVGPSGRCHPPKAVSPLAPYFAERQTVSVRNQYSASLEASAYPRITLQGIRAVGHSIDRPPVTLAIEPIRIGAGGGNDIRWFYKTHTDAETHLELSSENPPTHRVSYGISASSKMPENFRVKVEVFYHRKRIPRRLKSRFPPIFRFLKDVTARDIVMTLEATIGKEKADNFIFPGINKEGCDLDLELTFLGCGGNYVGQGIPIMGGKGSVKSRLDTVMKCEQH